MTARQPRAMNIAVIPKSHSQGVLDAGHDKLTTSYPLWTLDNETVTRLAAQADDDDNADSADGATVPTEPIVSASSSPPATRGRCLCNLVHASPPNKTPYPRKIVYLTPCATSQNSHVLNGSRIATSRRSNYALYEHACAHRIAAE
jgi:ectoine hydroxylase